MNTGITCKVWNIQGETATKNASSQLGDSIDYILNDLKTEYKMEMSGSPISDLLGQLGRECKYVQNDIKTVSGAYTGSRNLVSTDTRGAVAEMMELKNFYQKTNGRAALHGVISLCENESGITNAAALMELCESVLAEVFPNNQAIFGVHTDTDNLHIHFIINSVGLDGKKIHQDDKFIKNVLQPSVNKHAKRLGFTPNEKWDKEHEEMKKTFTEIKISLRKSIDYAIENAHNFDKFVQNLKDEGYSVNIGKYISLKNDEMGKAVRTHNLGVSYTKDAIVERIRSRCNAFEITEINDYTIKGKIEDVYTPHTVKLKRYVDMSPKEKEKALRLIRLGRNPWREHQKQNWQLNRIADQLNLQNRVNHYVSYYSKDDSLQGTLDGIVEAKKKINAEKQLISAQKKKYKVILDIYDEMKEISKKAYLYEYRNAVEYRSQFEKYRELTRRLKNGYGKDVYEVANFVQECKERWLYANAQLEELSEQYREVKQYAAQKGEHLKKNGSLLEAMDYFESKEAAKSNAFEISTSYIVSAGNTDVTIRVVKSPYRDERGRMVEGYELAVIDRYGEILERLDSREDAQGFSQAVKTLEKKYNFSDCKRFENIVLAREYLSEIQKNEVREDKTLENTFKQPISFAQALNHQTKNNKSFAIVDFYAPTYMVMVNEKGKELSITVFNHNNAIQENISIPIVSSATKEGFEKIKKIQEKYGFSDAVLTFDSIRDTKNFMESHMTNTDSEESTLERNTRTRGL